MSAISYVLATAVITACGGGDEPNAPGRVKAATWHAATVRTDFARLISAPTASALAMTVDTESLAAPWASGATYYVDPTIGSDSNPGVSPDAPRRTLSNRIDMNGVTVLLKRGTTIELSTPLYPRNTYIGTYGPSTTKPRVVVPAGYTYSIGVDSGQFKISDIVLIGNAALRASNEPGIGATKADSVIVEYCEIQSYANGVVFAGTGSVIRNNRISNVRKNGIHGGSTTSIAPSGSLISGNYINMAGSSDDGITLHDGSGFGRGNKIIGNMITGTNVENAVDLQGQFVDTLIEENRIDGSSQYSIVIDEPKPGAVESVGTIIRRNTISNVNPEQAAIYTRIPNVLISENVIYNSKSTRGGPAIAVEASARILNNIIHVPTTNIRSVFTIVQKTGVPAFGGEIRGNTVVNYSSQRFFALNAVDPQLMMDHWTIDQNSYRASDVSGKLFLNMDFSQWRTGGGSPLKTFKDALSTLAVL